MVGIVIAGNYSVRALCSVAHCASKLGPMFSYVRIVAENGRVTATATNKYILAWSTVDFDEGSGTTKPGERFETYLPAKEFLKLARCSRFFISGDLDNYNILADGVNYSGKLLGTKFPAVDILMQETTVLATKPTFINSRHLVLMDKIATTLRGVEDKNHKDHITPQKDTHVWEIAMPESGKKLRAVYGPVTVCVMSTIRLTDKTPLDSETFGQLDWKVG